MRRAPASLIDRFDIVNDIDENGLRARNMTSNSISRELSCRYFYQASSVFESHGCPRGFMVAVRDGAEKRLRYRVKYVAGRVKGARSSQALINEEWTSVLFLWSRQCTDIMYSARECEQNWKNLVSSENPDSTFCRSEEKKNSFDFFVRTARNLVFQEDVLVIELAKIDFPWDFFPREPWYISVHRFIHA